MFYSFKKIIFIILSSGLIFIYPDAKSSPSENFYAPYSKCSYKSALFREISDYYPTKIPMSYNPNWDYLRFKEDRYCVNQQTGQIIKVRRNDETQIFGNLNKISLRYNGTWLFEHKLKNNVIEEYSCKRLDNTYKCNGKSSYRKIAYNINSKNYKYAKLDYLKKSIENYSSELPQLQTWCEENVLAGIIYHELNDYKNAEKFLNQANKTPFYGYSSGCQKLIDRTLKIIQETNADYFKIQGQLKFESKDYIGAIKEYSNALKIDPQYLSAFFNRGIAKSEKGDYLGANSDFLKILEIDPNYLEQNTDVYYILGRNKTKEKDYKNAINYFTKSIENKKSKESFTMRGFSKSELKNYLEAIEDFSKALAIDPNYVIAYVNRGRSRVETGDLLRAIEDFSQATKLDPNFGDGFFNLARAQVLAKDNANAKRNFTLAIKNYKKKNVPEENKVNFLESYFNRGMIYFQEEKYKKAISDFSKGLEIRPDPLLYNFLGQSKFFLKQYTEAIEFFSKAIEIDPYLKDSYFGIAFSYEVLDDIRNAKENYIKAINIEQESKTLSEFKKIDNNFYMRAYRSAGIFFLELEDYENSIKSISKALNIDPKFGNLYSIRGFAYGRSNNNIKACLDFEKGYELGDQSSIEWWSKHKDLCLEIKDKSNS